MNDTPATPPDPLDDLLNPRPVPPGVDPLRQLLWSRTAAVLWRRRWLKRAAFAAALAACYVAGMLTMRLATTPARPPADPELANRRPKERQEKRALPRAPTPPDRKNPDMAEMAESPLALEWQAIDSANRRAELYRRAGDRYLEADDIPSALRCYRGALAAGSKKDWAISVHDNWLLMVAKQERQKEGRNAQNGG
jgi:hypothetical protein